MLCRYNYAQNYSSLIIRSTCLQLKIFYRIVKCMTIITIRIFPLSLWVWAYLLKVIIQLHFEQVSIVCRRCKRPTHPGKIHSFNRTPTHMIKNRNVSAKNFCDDVINQYFSYSIKLYSNSYLFFNCTKWKQICCY